MNLTETIKKTLMGKKVFRESMDISLDSLADFLIDYEVHPYQITDKYGYTSEELVQRWAKDTIGNYSEEYDHFNFESEQSFVEFLNQIKQRSKEIADFFNND